MNLQAQITKEMKRLNIGGQYGHDNNVHVIPAALPNGGTGLITFTVASKPYWAKLTDTGRLKKNSIRIDNF